MRLHAKSLRLPATSHSVTPYSRHDFLNSRTFSTWAFEAIARRKATARSKARIPSWGVHVIDECGTQTLTCAVRNRQRYIGGIQFLLWRLLPLHSQGLSLLLHRLFRHSIIPIINFRPHSIPKLLQVPGPYPSLNTEPAAAYSDRSPLAANRPFEWTKST